MPPVRPPLRSGGSSGGDALISFITSYLGTHPEQTSKPPSAAAATIDGTSRSGSTGGSGIAELHTDARLWEVQWSELTVLQRIGRGSFGSVYLAEWSHTQVAVKVLVSKSELVGRLASVLGAILLCGSVMRCPQAAFCTHIFQMMLAADSWSCRSACYGSCRLRQQ